jgi:kynureninase
MEPTLFFARTSDEQDPLASFRDQYFIPKSESKEVVYFCGNSLGLQPKAAAAAINQELEKWAELGVEGHFLGKMPWMHYHKFLEEGSCFVAGAKPGEVVVMNNLTVNLHLMLVSFYRPKNQRFKIIMESGAFPSDQYAIESQVRFHGYDPEKAIIELKPRNSEFSLHTEDILAAIEEAGSDLALVMMGGVNYYTGQFYDLQAITEAAHRVGALAGFDLAHAAGNVELKLHDWQVDFGVWCSYKYLNSGPGGTSGVFVHQNHAKAELPRFAGWWGHKEEVRFEMKKGFIPMEGAQGWQLSNAQIFPMAIHKASLDIFMEAGWEKLSQKSQKLTGFLEFLIQHFNRSAKNPIQIITPKSRGCQLSIIVENGRKLHHFLTQKGIVTDWREPDVIRLAPVPLYNRFEEVWQFYQALLEFEANEQP